MRDPFRLSALRHIREFLSLVVPGPRVAVRAPRMTWNPRMIRAPNFLDCRVKPGNDKSVKPGNDERAEPGE
jgi:hypothetical protein